MEQERAAFVATLSSLQDLQMKPAEDNKLAAMERSSPQDWPLPKTNPATNGTLKFTRNFQHSNIFSQLLIFITLLGCTGKKMREENKVIGV